MDPHPVRMALPSTPCVDAPSGQRAAQRVGGRAKRASRSRARWKKKGCLSAALSSRGDDHRTHPSNDLHPPHRESPGETSPSVEGLPRQGRGEAGKGRGPRVATQRVGRRAKRASRPAPDKRKGLPFGSPLLFPQRQGSHQCRIHARNHLEKQAPLLRGCPDRGGERQAKGGAHALRRNVWGDVRNARRVPRQIKEKGCRKAALFFYLAERGGFEPPRRYKRLPDFESGTFNHSATSPGGPRRTGDAHHTRK